MVEENNQSLVKCLEAAISEPDLVADIIEACRLSNTSAGDLAGWSLEDIASKLFLTEAEAAKLSDVCKQVCEGNLSVLDPKEHPPQAEEVGATAQGAAAAAERDGALPSEQHDSNEKAKQEGKGEDEQQASPEERTPEPEDRGFPPTSTEDASEEVTPAPVQNGDHQDVENGHHEEEEEDQAAGDQEQKSAAAAAAAMAAAAEAVPMPSSSPPSARSLHKQESSTKKNDGYQAPVMEISHENPDSSSRVPSYLRPTTSFKAHTGKLVQEKSPSPEASPLNRSGSARKVNTASSRLLAPTASYLTRVTSARKESKAAREAAEAAERERKAKELKKVMESPQGQRVTRVEPFRFKTEEVPKSATLSSDERALLEAQKNAFRRHEVPKHVKEHRPIEGKRVVSTPKSPQEVFKPFQLASLEKHEKYRQMAEQRKAEEKRKEEEARRFHAQELDRRMLEQPNSPKPRSPPPVTQSQEFKFSSEERVRLHKEVLEPMKKSRLSQAEREKLEAHEREVREEEFRQKEAKAIAAAQKQREKELEKMDISEYRKSLTFKAGSMPTFRSPFSPDLSKSQRVTDSIEFNFHTDRKLGRPKTISEREDAAAPQLPGGSFLSSLRASTNQPISPSMRASMRSSMRMSSARSPSGGPGSLRNSTNSLPLSAQRHGIKRPASARVGSRANQGVEAH